MSESRVRENRTHGSMRRREATPDQSAQPRGPRTPPADPTTRASRRSASATRRRPTAEMRTSRATRDSRRCDGDDRRAKKAGQRDSGWRPRMRGHQELAGAGRPTAPRAARAHGGVSGVQPAGAPHCAATSSSPSIPVGMPRTLGGRPSRSRRCNASRPAHPSCQPMCACAC